VNFPNKTP